MLECKNNNFNNLHRELARECELRNRFKNICFLLLVRGREGLYYPGLLTLNIFKFIFSPILRFLMSWYNWIFQFIFHLSILSYRTNDDVEKHRNKFPTLKLYILQIENTFNQFGFLQS